MIGFSKGIIQYRLIISWSRDELCRDDFMVVLLPCAAGALLDSYVVREVSLRCEGQRMALYLRLRQGSGRYDVQVGSLLS